MSAQLTEVLQGLLQVPSDRAIQDIVLGVALLALGGNGLIRGAMGLARRLNLSPLFVGIAIVALGTSAPEFGIAITSVLVGKPHIGVGTVVGANIVNILFILALGALLRPLTIRAATIRRDGLALVSVTGLLLWVSQLATLSVLVGGIFVGVLALYLIVTLVTEPSPKVPRAAVQDQAKTIAARDVATHSLALNGLFVIAGTAALFFGAYFMIEGTVSFARENGIGEVALSLSVVALGASLPELVAMFYAVARKQPDLMVGTLIGSSIINILGVLGVAALLSPVDIELRDTFAWDLWIMLGAALLLIPFMATGRRLSRIEAFFMLAAYAGYIYFLFNDHARF